MPYKRARRTYRRRYVPRKRRRYTKKRTVSTVKRIIGRLAEKKRNIREFATADISTTGNIFDLSIVPKELAADDSTDLKREGDKLTITSLDFIAHITVGDTSNICRFIIFKWKPDNTTAPTKGDILKDADATALDTLRRYNEDTSSQYKVCYDRVVNLDSNGRRTTSLRRKLYGKALGSPKLTFSSNDGTVGQGKYYLLVVSDSGAASHPTFSAVTRSEYYDF